MVGERSADENGPTLDLYAAANVLGTLTVFICLSLRCKKSRKSGREVVFAARHIMLHYHISVSESCAEIANFFNNISDNLDRDIL